MTVRARLSIRGLVQDVFFRATALDQAQRLQIRGWVKNCRDGSVEVVAEGEHDDVQRLIDWCRHGPPGAVVRGVDIKWEEPLAKDRDFTIRR